MPSTIHEQLAEALELSLGELKALRRQIAAAESGLQTTHKKSERTEAAARRLSLTAVELKALRSALATPSEAATARSRALARHVLGLPPLRSKIDAPAPKQGARGSTQVRPTQRTGSPIYKPVVGHSPLWSPDTRVFITAWGDVIHLHADCHGIRGFRHVDEPDPKVHQVSLRDPVCGNRRACRKCFDVWSSTTIDRFDGFLEDLHGRRRPAAPARRVVRSTSPPAPFSGTKAARDAQAARRLGITITQLKARRRAEHEANLRKKKGR